MKKGEAVKDISPENDIDDNLMIAMYGRAFSETKRAFQALRGFEMLQLGLEHLPESTRDTNSTKAALLDQMKPFITAINKRDSIFFQEVAYVLGWWKKNPKSYASPDWVKFITYIWREKRRIRYGERSTRVTRKEVADYMGAPDLFSDTRLSEMIGKLGVYLVGGKPGPTLTGKQAMKARRRK